MGEIFTSTMRMATSQCGEIFVHHAPQPVDHDAWSTVAAASDPWQHVTEHLLWDWQQRPALRSLEAPRAQLSSWPRAPLSVPILPLLGPAAHRARVGQACQSAASLRQERRPGVHSTHFAAPRPAAQSAHPPASPQVNLCTE